MKMNKYAKHSIILLAAAASSACWAARGWWGEDIWQVDASERPFLYYGERDEDVVLNEAPAQRRRLEDIKSMDELKEEARIRLDAAVMNPTQENIAAYQEVNSFMLGKAHVFAQAWEKSRFKNPQFDWTALHPTVNAAKSRIDERSDALKKEFASQAARFSGFFLFVDDGELSKAAAAPVRIFSRRYGFELLVVSRDGGDFEGMPTKKASPALLEAFAPKIYPSLYLIPNNGVEKPSWMPDKHVLLMAGASSVAGLETRLAALFSPDIGLGNDEAASGLALAPLIEEAALLKSRHESDESAFPRSSRHEYVEEIDSAEYELHQHE